MRHEYSIGIPNPDDIAPEDYTLDAALLARPGNVDIQLDLYFLDYANKVVKLYPGNFRSTSCLAAAAARHLGPARHLLHALRALKPCVAISHPRPSSFLTPNTSRSSTQLKEITAAMRRFLAIHVT